MYYVYKNCDLVRKFKTKWHTVRFVKRLMKKSHQIYELIEVMDKKHLLFYW